MGRKIEMRKIEDVTKCQVTFSKRRSNLIKKANEIATCCDVDVAFVAFSPSGRVSKFCNRKRIEDVLNHYVNIPAHKRINHISNVQGKTEKLRQLGHINGDRSKLHYLDKQIENLELQIKKSGLELQILEVELRDYELDPEQDPSLHQLSWCERNLNYSLERILARKNALAGNLPMSCGQPSLQMDEMEMERQLKMPFLSNSNKNKLVSTENPSAGQCGMQLDPWISPYSARVRDGLFQDLLNQAKCTSHENQGLSNNQSLMEDHTLLNLDYQNSANSCNDSTSANFLDAIHRSAQSICNIQHPRFTSIATITTKAGANANMPQSINEEIMRVSLPYTSSSLSQFTNTIGQETLQLNMDHDNSFSNGSPRNGNADEEDGCRINNNDEIHENDRSKALHHVHPHKEAGIETLYDNILQRDVLGDNASWTSKMQKSSLWEWEDLLLDENFNFRDCL